MKNQSVVIGILAIITIFGALLYMGKLPFSIESNYPNPVSVNFAFTLNGDTLNEPCAYHSRPPALKVINVPDDYKQEFIKNGLAPESYSRVYAIGSNTGGLDRRMFPSAEVGSDGSIYIIGQTDTYLDGGGSPGDGSTCIITHHIVFRIPSALPPPPIQQTVCGDKFCSEGETTSSCPYDCGSKGGGQNNLWPPYIILLIGIAIVFIVFILYLRKK